MVGPPFMGENPEMVVFVLGRQIMNSFFKIWKEDKSSSSLFIMFAIMILPGISYIIFAMFYPVK
jgi:hypothetical protein